MVHNRIYLPTTGKDPMKFEHIGAFEKFTTSGMVKLVVPSFRNAGKVKAFVQEHAIANYYNDYNWNGYGYEDHDNYYLLSRKDAMTVLEMIDSKNKRPKPTHEEKKKAWARRLARLTGISVEQAETIAEEKEEYQQKRIDFLADRQDKHYSVTRTKLIRKLGRENPLRHIRDEHHANAILAASVRHKGSDYEAALEEGREKAAWGEIDRSEVKEYARTHTRYYETVGSMYFGNE